MTGLARWVALPRPDSLPAIRVAPENRQHSRPGHQGHSGFAPRDGRADAEHQPGADAQSAPGAFISDLPGIRRQLPPASRPQAKSDRATGSDPGPALGEGLGYPSPPSTRPERTAQITICCLVLNPSFFWTPDTALRTVSALIVLISPISW